MRENCFKINRSKENLFLSYSFFFSTYLWCLASSSKSIFF